MASITSLKPFYTCAVDPTSRLAVLFERQWYPFFFLGRGDAALLVRFIRRPRQTSTATDSRTQRTTTIRRLASTKVNNCDGSLSKRNVVSASSGPVDGLGEGGWSSVLDVVLIGLFSSSAGPGTVIKIKSILDKMMSGHNYGLHITSLTTVFDEIQYESTGVYALRATLSQ